MVLTLSRTVVVERCAIASPKLLDEQVLKCVREETWKETWKDGRVSGVLSISKQDESSCSGHDE